MVVGVSRAQARKHFYMQIQSENETKMQVQVEQAKNRIGHQIVVPMRDRHLDSFQLDWATGNGAASEGN